MDAKTKALIKEKLQTLASLQRYPPQKIKVDADPAYHTMTLTYVGNRDQLDSIANVVRDLLGAGMGERLPGRIIPAGEDVTRMISQCSSLHMPVTIGNMTVTEKKPFLFELSVVSMKWGKDIAAALDTAVARRQSVHTVGQVTDYFAERAKARFPTCKKTIAVKEDGPARSIFRISVENTSGMDNARFLESMRDFAERAERMFGMTTPVTLSMAGSGATLSITGNPELLLQAIQEKDLGHATGNTKLQK